ncbi:hypothetical protein F0562_034463 [Nyssa sinensis]|uniref:NB-ARC domain-containing protein n=1 Tax=Nyssa sinensis TaxID=561372 RepID=A0A5J5AG14_9ASTE|nr:hypothetical protein F0562_034463 [Nyssa sinensis]
MEENMENLVEDENPVCFRGWCPNVCSHGIGKITERFESRALVFQDIVKALRDDEIYMVGIYGAGGVGKTRMAEEIGKQAAQDKLFDEVAMASVSQDLDVRKIQGLLADCLNLKLDLETEIGRAGQLCNRLKNGRQIIVIIDDVWNQINLKGNKNSIYGEYQGLQNCVEYSDKKVSAIR